MAKKEKPNKDLCRLVTPEFRVSYPHVFKPNAVKPTDKPKYSITMLFDKKADLTSVKAAIKNAKIAKYGPKENWPDDLQSPVTDGDNPKFADKEGYKGSWVIKASSQEDSKPGIVDERAVPITDTSKFYPGCYAHAYVYAYCWEFMSKEGVGFILDHVQKTNDGDSFGGKKPVDQVFAPLSGSDSDDEDLDDEDDGDDFM